MRSLISKSSTMTLEQNINPFKWIVLLLLLVTVCALKQANAQDSTTVLCLTEEEVRVFNDIYDGREECYEHFLRAVELVRNLRNLDVQLRRNNRKLEKLVERYQLDEVDYETALQLSADDMSALQKEIHKLNKKVNRRNTLLYILSGVAVAETVVLVSVFATR